MDAQGPTSLPGLIRGVALATGDAEALREVDGPAVTYAELDLRSRKWATVLAAHGVEAGDRVAVLMPSSVDGFLAWLGISWLRAVETPINTHYRGTVLAHVLDDCAARVLVVGGQYLERIAEVAPALRHLRTVLVVGDGPARALPAPLEAVPLAAAVVEDADAVDPTSAPEGHDLCCVMYTSGTTGPSKGVLMPWACLAATARSFAFTDALAGGGTLYSPLPTFHIGGKAALHSTAMAAGRLVVRDGFSTESFWDDVRRYDACCAGLVGATAAFLARQPRRPGERDTPLREVLMGPLLPDYREFEQRFGVTVRTLFGMTEVGGPIGAMGGFPDHRTCGRTLPGYEVRVVDEHDRVVGPGDVGELIVRSDEPWVMNVGYLHKPELTARAWRNGWFHTGDYFTRDEDGWFYFVDRKKDAIRRRGENISSFEVEAEVTAHDDVVEAAAVAVPSEVGEDEIKIVVVRRHDSRLTPGALVEHLMSRMPRFMVPRYVEFVAELPKSPTAKVLKAQLRQAGVTPTTWDREAGGSRA